MPAPAALLREARRQKGLDSLPVPPVCILDPDGDLVRRLRQTGAAKPFAGWPCYHTELDTFDLGAQQVGIVGRVVGASFAVLVAEELFASGCQLLVVGRQPKELSKRQLYAMLAEAVRNTG